jgi:glycosyltransferase involved in cell wall biosynthesis
MKKTAKDVSIVLGCYNAAPCVEAKILALAAFLESLGRTYEIVVVEDGSLDGSAEVLRDLESRLPHLVVFESPKNMGKGFAVRTGILNCAGRLIVFTDVDMAYALENLAAVLERLEAGSPVAVGNRRLPGSIYTVSNALVRYVYRRHRTGAAFNWVVRSLFGLSARDTQSGLKGFQRDAAREIFRTIHTDGFLFDVEIFIRAKKLKIEIEEVPVHVSYTSDESTVQHLVEFFRVAPQLAKMKWLELRGAYDPDPGVRFSVPVGRRT